MTALGGVTLASEPHDRAGRVLHSTVGRFKGLASDVILCDADPADERCGRRVRRELARRDWHYAGKASAIPREIVASR